MNDGEVKAKHETSIKRSGSEQVVNSVYRLHELTATGVKKKKKLFASGLSEL